MTSRRSLDERPGIAPSRSRWTLGISKYGELEKPKGAARDADDALVAATLAPQRLIIRVLNSLQLDESGLGETTVGVLG